MSQMSTDRDFINTEKKKQKATVLRLLDQSPEYLHVLYFWRRVKRQNQEDAGAMIADWAEEWRCYTVRQWQRAGKAEEKYVIDVRYLTFRNEDDFPMTYSPVE